MKPNAALLLLDRSGSMANCVDLTVDGVNTFLQRLRDDESGRGAQIELITFDSQGFDTIRKGSIDEVRNITTSEYQPRSMTPLYDAVQHALERLNDTPANRRMLIILTDGKENASKRMACRAVHDAEQAGALPHIPMTTFAESKTPPDGWKDI